MLLSFNFLCDFVIVELQSLAKYSGIVMKFYVYREQESS